MVKFITANVAAGSTGLSEEKLAKVLNRGDVVENLARAEMYGNVVASSLGVSPESSGASSGTALASATETNQDARADLNKKVQGVVTTAS